MSGGESIEGAVDNGRRGHADFEFYVGPVGIRERDHGLDVAFFSPPLRLKKLPVEGRLDGAAVRIVAVRARDMNPNQPTKPNDRTPRVIVATVMPAH